MDGECGFDAFTNTDYITNMDILPDALLTNVHANIYFVVQADQNRAPVAGRAEHGLRLYDLGSPHTVRV